VRKSGFSEQSFIAEMRQMMWRTREMAILPIGADGGITADTASLMIQLEAQVLVAGSAVYKGDPASEMRRIIEAGRRAARK
jgi:ribulose-phosphate 3-epimerase